jgi:hypothetical protein
VLIKSSSCGSLVNTLYSIGNWFPCNNSQFEDENKGFLILIDEHYGESYIMPFRTVMGFELNLNESL